MHKTSLHLAGAVLALASFSTPVAAAPSARAANPSAKLTKMPKVIFFDVNETLLDLSAMRASVGEALGGREDLLPLWFSTMLHHSLVDSTTKRFHTFGEVGVAALLMVAKVQGIELSPEAAKASIVTPLRSLPPHPDVIPGLKAPKKMSPKLVSLTNSSNLGVKTQFENAKLIEYFDGRLSVEDIETYKPDLSTYRWAAKKMGVAIEDTMLVAAHGWDIAGAKAAGMQAVFIRRPGKVLYPLAIPPDLEVDGLDGLVKALEATAR